jgi:Ca-activated chloride channel family protein
MNRVPSVLLLAFCICAISIITYSQTPTPKAKSEDDDVIKVQSRLIVVPVSVTDASGEPVAGLTKADFKIAEANRPQVIDQVADAEKAPLEIALLIDVSGSVNPLFDFEKQTAAQFLQSVMKPDDRATIFLIGDKPVSGLVRENAVEAAERVKTVTLSGKFTAFYDTVSMAAQYLRRNAPERSRRVIVALTDGEDNWSDLTRKAELSAYKDLDVNSLNQQKMNQLAARSDQAHVAAQQQILHDLQDADTVFYSINPAGDSLKLNKISMRAQTGMEKFANETGGSALVPRLLPVNDKNPLQNPGNMAKNQETLVTLFRRLANELRAQYLIQYYSESDFPLNQFIKLDVGMVNRTALRLRARQGYYVKP